MTKASDLKRWTGDTPDTLRARAVDMALEKAVNNFVEDLDPAGFETRPPYPFAEQAWGQNREPMPLPAIQAARVIAAQARRLEAAAIAHARGRGESWTSIGKALGPEFVKEAGREDMKLGLAAWRYAAFKVMPSEEVPYRTSYQRDIANWRCWTCGQHVEESHPDNGPDAEKGHTAGCERLIKRRKAGYR